MSGCWKTNRGIERWIIWVFPLELGSSEMDISPLPDIGNEVLVERSKAHVDPSTVPVICGSGSVDEGKAAAEERIQLKTRRGEGEEGIKWNTRRGEDTVEYQERRGYSGIQGEERKISGFRV